MFDNQYDYENYFFLNLYEGSSPFKNIKENSQKKEVRNKSYLAL